MEQLIPLDYATLRVIWWALLGFLLVACAIMAGFDPGVATVLPLVAKRAVDRRSVLNVVGRAWAGNPAWMLVVGGVGFDACLQSHVRSTQRLEGNDWD